jgi:hypothetical protein
VHVAVGDDAGEALGDAGELDGDGVVAVELLVAPGLSGRMTYSLLRGGTGRDGARRTLARSPGPVVAGGHSVGR